MAFFSWIDWDYETSWEITNGTYYKKTDIEELQKETFENYMRFAKCTFENSQDTDSDIMKIAKNYATSFSVCDTYKVNRSPNLLLSGGVGVGKTHVVACIANELIKTNNITVIIANLAQIERTLWGAKENEKQKLFKALSYCGLLVLDDFGTERQTDYMQEIAYDVIDARYSVGFPMIITTNFNSTQIFSPATQQMQRIFSRIYDDTILLNVTGEDRRKKRMLEQSQAEMAKLLNK